MNVEDFQGELADVIRATTGLTNVAVVEDDGTYPKIPSLEASLKDIGLAIVVFQPTGADLIDAASTGHVYLSVAVKVAIEERVSFNRSADGTGVTCLEAMRRVLQQVLGSLGGPNPHSKVMLRNPFVNLNTEHGVQASGFEVVKKFLFSPA